MQHGIKSPLCWLLIVLALSGVQGGTDEAEVIDTRRGCIQVSRNEIVTRDKCKTFLAVASHVRLDTLKFCELCDNEDGCNQASTLLPTTCLVLVTLLAKLVFL
ncbi:hypothetical protein B566_EDAN013090 [Ephemera danica]|nr:hypothetical protein B566_EDAN013090 [Ephemera danica]